MTRIGHRLWDDLDLRSEPPVPTHVTTLLAQLEKLHAPVGEQTAAIRDWLETNVPGKALSRSLRASEFADLLPPDTHAA